MKSGKIKNYCKRPLLLVALLILITTIPLVLLVFKKPTKVSAAWFDDAWGYRQFVAITNGSGATQTDYQIQITLATNALVTAGKMQGDCRDIRITDPTGNLLPYWIEPGTCNGASTLIWTKVNTIPSSNGYVYIYYGNPSASAQTSAAKTFIREITGVQGAWKMDETSWTQNCTATDIADSSGNSHNGKSCPSTTGPTTTSSGKFGYAGSFDATDDYADLTNSTDFDAGTTDSFTAEFWMKVADDNSTSTVLSKGGAPGWRFRTRSTDNTIFFQVRASGDNGQADSSDAISQVTNGNWHHIVGVRDVSSDTVKIYVDGVQHDSQPDNTTTTITNTSSLTAGLSGDPVNGTIDEVRYYNKALTAGEITDLANNYGYATTNYANRILVRKRAATEPSAAAPATEEKTTGPAAWWRFDEGTGTTPSDSTVNKNNGVFSNSPTWANDDLCVSGKCLNFPGTNASVTVANTVSVQSVSLWVKSATSSAAMITLKGGSLVSATSGTITAGGFTTPTYYVNGVQTNSPTLTANQWTNVVVTTATAITANTIKIGSSSNNFLQGFMDNVKLYNFALSASQIQANYNSGKARVASLKGAGAILGGVNPDIVGPSSNGLVGYWKMDEASWTVDCSTDSALDASGNAKNGDACPATTGPAGGAAGKFGNGGNFDGTDDFLNIGNQSIYDFGDGQDFTLTAWINRDTFTNNHSIIAKRNGVAASAAGYNLWIDNNTDDFRFEVSDGTNEYQLQSTTTVTSTGWYQVTVVFDEDSTNNTQIYINGVKDTSATTGTLSSVGSLSTTRCLTIGAYASNAGCTTGGYPFDGKIDDVRIYNRALSPAEVSQLYNWAPGPVGYWKFDEKSGNIAADSSGNGHNGSWTGSGPVWWTQGKYGNAGNSNGSDDMVAFGTEYGSDSMTLEMWIKPFSLVSGFGQTVMFGNDYDSDGCNYPTGLGPDNNDNNQWMFQIYNSTGASCTITGIVGGNFTLGHWDHVTGVLSGSNMYLYVNGVLVNSGTLTGTRAATPMNGQTWSINNIYQNFYYLAQLDEVKIYNYARTPKQIVSDMNAGHPAGGSPVGSQAIYYPMDEGYGSTVHDKGTSGSNGTVGVGSNLSSSGMWRDGKIGKCIQNQGTDSTDYSRISAGDLSLFDSRTQMTASFWLKPNTLTVNRALVSKSNIILTKASATDASFWIGEDATNSDEIRVYVASGATDVANYYTTSNLNLSNYIWDHVVVVYDGTQTPDKRVTVYKNGLPVLGSMTGTIPASMVTTSATSFKVGGDDAPQVSNFIGLIDEFKLYTYPLTSDDVKLDYNRGSATVLGVLSDTSGLTGGIVASNSASASYCIPGDTTSCASPFAIWDFEEGSGGTVNDISGSGTNLTWSGTGEHWINSKVGKGGKLNGIDDYVNNETGNNNYHTSDQTGTIEFWVKVLGSTGTDQSLIASGNEASSLINYLVVGINDSKQFGFRQKNNDTLDSVGTTATYNYNQWYHLAVISNGSAYSIYINGVNQALTVTSGGNNGDWFADTNNRDNITIGAVKTSSVSNYANSIIDQVRIFDYARTPAQIAWDYNRGGPVAWWKFNECQGTVAHDSSGNQNEGTITITSGGAGSQDSAGTCTTVNTTTAWYNGRNGKYNSSINLDGTNDYVAAGSNDSVDSLGPMSISAWIYPNSGSFEGYIVAKRDGAGTGYFNFAYDTSFYTSALDFQKDTDGTTLETTSANNAVTPNAWNHVVMTWDGSLIAAGVHFYVNGRETAYQLKQDGTGNLLSDAAHNVLIGSRGGTQSYFKGQIDDVKIFRYVLTASQVRNDYNRSSAVQFAPITGTP